MVKNLPSVERSTKIRFGKHVPDSNDQEENTIVFNASNVAVPTPYSNSVYLSPVRNRTDYQAPEIVLLMYDRVTKEITESGESANALIGGSTLDAVVNRNNATSNVVQLTAVPESLITYGNVGIANTLATHTVSVGSNLYIDEFGSNVLVVSGNVAVLKDMIVEGNLTVNGDTTVIYTENTSIKDAFIELGADNTSGDTTLDLGVLMHRPDALSNVVIGYREGNDEFTIAYTDAQPTDKTFTPKTDEDINVHVYGLTHVDANIYAHEDVLVDGNVYVSQNVSVTEELTVTGNVYADKDLIVSANTHLRGDNVFITHTMDFLDPKTAIVTDQVSNVQIRLGQLENVANTASNPLDNQVLMYEGGEWTNNYPNHSFLTIKNDSLSTMVAGNAVYISGYQNSNLAKVKLAKSDSPTTMPAIGVVYSDTIAPGEEGLATAYGKVNQINTNGYNVGETLYVSNLYAGWISNVKPYYTDSQPNLIQNLGVVTRKDTSHGAMFVTGIGRANDIPNAELITDYNEMNYVYVNDTNNDLKKITSANLNIPLTTAVSSSSNSAANAVTLRGVSITSGDGFHGDLVVAGNVTVDSTTFHVDTETSNVGIGKTDPGFTLDVDGDINFSGKFYEDGVEFISSPWTIETGPDALSYATGNVGIGKANPGFTLDVDGDINFTGTFYEDGVEFVSSPWTIETGPDALSYTAGNVGVGVANPGSTLQVTGNTYVSSNLQVGEVANLYVDTETSRVGINTDSPGYTLDVRGTSNVGVFTTPDATITDSTVATSKTTGALKVTGGVGVQGDLYATDGHFSTDVSVGSLTNKKIPYANASKILTDSQISQEDDGTIVISNDVEITGSLLVSGESFEVSAGELVVQDRIIDIANNNPEHDLDIGILMEHPGHNIGIIHHSTDELTIGYTQNGYGDDHILRDYSNHITMNVWGHVITQNTITIVHNDLHVESGKIGVNTTNPTADIYISGNTYISSNLQVGEVANLYVDTETSNVGIGKTDPGFTLDVVGDINFTGKFYEDGVEFVSSPWTIETGPDALSYTTGSVGIGAANPDSTLQVTGNTYISSNLQVGEVANLYVDTETSNVGIGKTDPGFTLDVVGDINFSGSLYEDGAAFVSSPWTMDGDDLEYTSGNVGIGTDAAAATLHVGGNIYSTSNISAYEIDVANVTTTNLIIDTVTVSATLSLDNVVNVSNITSNTVQFINSDVGLVATGNVVANYFKGDGSKLTGIATTLQSVSDFGNTSSNVIQFTNADVGLVATGNVVANYFKGDGSQLTGIATTLQSVSDFGNTSSNTIQFTNATTGFVTTSNVTVGGIAKQTAVPAFTVRLTDGTVVGAGDIDYNQVDTDNTSSYTTSDGRFTAPVAGHYFFSAHGIYQNDVTIYDFTVNGTRQNINSLCSSPSTNYIQCNISAVLNLSVGDYVNVYQVEGGTFGTDNNVFTGFFIG